MRVTAQRRVSGRLAALILASTVAVGCGGGVPPESVIVTGPDGLRTFTTVHEIGGKPVACPAYGVVDPVRGTFEGRQGEREPAWLIDPGGRQLSVVWPQGFSVQFEPLAALYDDAGNVVARARQEVELGQVSRDSAAGTYEDPYIAAGILFGGCYPYIAGPSAEP